MSSIGEWVRRYGDLVCKKGLPLASSYRSLFHVPEGKTVRVMILGCA